MADVDPDSPASCHSTELEQNDKPPEVPEMVSPGLSYFPIVTPESHPEYPWIKNQSGEHKIENAAFATWNNEDLMDDLDCDIADLDTQNLDSQNLEEEVLVEEDLDDFDAFQSDVPRKINKDTDSPKGLPKGAPELATMVEYLELMTEQNHEMLKVIKTLTTRLDILENRLIHALWDPEGAADQMFKRHGKSGRPKAAWEKSEDEKRPAATKVEAGAPLRPMQETPKTPKQETKSELKIQQTALMQYQRHKQLMSEAAEREMIERALVESQHVYTRLGMPEVKPINPRPVSIAGFFDSHDPKKESGFGEPNKYA